MKLKLCAGCDEQKKIWKNHAGNKYCQYCWNKIKFQEDPPKQKPRKAIKPKSKKQAALDRSYSLLRTPFMLKHPNCQAALAGCQGGSTDVHHKKGRGPYLLMTNTWMAVCRTCHQWIETHPIEATEMGFRESKLTE
jgi:hypothetical protein